jgi:hypothetical protein
MSERWLPVPGWSSYEVSDLGSVRRHAGGGQPLKPHFDGQRYLAVCLSEAGIRTTKRIHCLVAAAFIGPRPDGLEVRHFDGDSFNNSASNLRYGTRAENQADRSRHGTDPRVKTSCLRGHPFDEANTRWNPKGRRVCRACHAEREKNRYRAARARQAENIQGRQ